MGYVGFGATLRHEWEIGVRALVFLCRLAAIAPTQAAAWTGDAQLCATIEGDHAFAILHCTRAIESGQLSAGELANTYGNRA